MRKLFSKFKDYNLILEEILEKKTFTSFAKSLLLNMIYKLEISLGDYNKVKKNSLSKDIVLDNILSIINNYCDNINIVEPDSVQSEILRINEVDAVTNYKERSILSYPTEEAILYAIVDIEPKYFYMKKDFYMKDTFQKILVEAYKANSLETLQNFNGWSWTENTTKYCDYISNIIYQNIISIKGEKFLQDWRKDSELVENYLEDLRNTIYKITENDDYYVSLCRLLYLIASQKEKIALKKFLLNLQNDFKMLENSKFQKDKLKNEIIFYNSIVKNKNTEYEELVELQKQFLIIFQRKIEKINSPEEIMDILYEIRYYQNLKFCEGVLIKDFKEIKKMLNYIQKKAIFNACNLGILKIISLNVEDNFEIIRYILDTKIIDFRDIKINIDYDSENIFVKVYDKEIFEKNGKYKFDGNKKNIVIKKNKTFKLFN